MDFLESTSMKIKEICLGCHSLGKIKDSEVGAIAHGHSHPWNLSAITITKKTKCGMSGLI